MASAYVGSKENAGIIVHEADAFVYAKCSIDEFNEKEKQEYVEWFFSGNWRKENVKEL